MLRRGIEPTPLAIDLAPLAVYAPADRARQQMQVLVGVSYFCAPLPVPPDGSSGRSELAHQSCGAHPNAALGRQRTGLMLTLHGLFAVAAASGCSQKSVLSEKQIDAFNRAQKGVRTHFCFPARGKICDGAVGSVSRISAHVFTIWRHLSALPGAQLSIL